MNFLRELFKWKGGEKPRPTPTDHKPGYSVLCCITASLLSGCVEQGPNESATATSMPSAEYALQRASQQVDALGKASWQLQAANALLAGHQSRLAAKELDQIQPQNDLQSQRLMLLTGNALAQRQQPATAMRLLRQLRTTEEMPVQWQENYHQLLGRLYCQSNAALPCLEQAIALDALPATPQQHHQQRLSFWQTLLNIPISDLAQTETTLAPTLEGWLSLRQAMEESLDQPTSSMFDAIDQWQQAHPEHAANDLLKPTHGSIPHAIHRIALLLPTNGPFREPGEALKDGFIQAYLSDTNKALTFKLYDTHKQDIAVLYQKALKEGADLVIGPLLKSDIDALAKTRLKRPTIALNESNQKHHLTNMYYFAYSPQQEAQALATKVFMDGVRHPLVITDDNPRQQLLAQTFTHSWETHSKRAPIVVALANQPTLNQSIQQLLGIEHSKQRAQLLSQTIGEKPKFYPRRRQDIDSILIFSSSAKARQIKPLLDFYFAGNLPTYSTSQIYLGLNDPHSDSDLNGIIFGDVPWLLQSVDQLKHKKWPEALNSYNRLFAIGQASYRISKCFDVIARYPDLGLPADPGHITLSSSTDFSISPQWAQFNQGIATPSLG